MVCVLYLRLSRDDERNSDSESIVNQRDFLHSYAERNGFEISGEFCDDGYSGTNFDRPAFCKMLNEIENGSIHIILTKDLSRLGRDYIKTGYYLEQYFPSKKVRYIAVNDGIDTLFDTPANDMAPFRAVFNDMYAKDISKKVRSALDTKKREGKFIGALAPYGYKKHPFDHNLLIVDNEKAEIVKNIFKMRIQGLSYSEISRTLTAKGIPSPSSKSEKWNDVTVKRIIKNPLYSGHLVQSRTKKINYKVKKRMYLPPCDWIIVKNTHEAIISEEIFEKANSFSTSAP